MSDIKRKKERIDIKRKKAKKKEDIKEERIDI